MAITNFMIEFILLGLIIINGRRINELEDKVSMLEKQRRWKITANL